MSGFILVFVGSQFSFDADDYYLMMFAYMELFVGFILVTVGLHSYPKNRMNSLSSFGWWVFVIATWLEVFFIGAWIKWLDCYSPDCERVHDINANPYCWVPVVFMLFGLVIVYAGKKKGLNEPMSERQEKPKQDQPVAVQRGLRWGLISAVALLIIALQVVTNWIILYLGGEAHSSHISYIVTSTVIAVLCCGCGGFVVGATAGYRGATHGILSALIAWAINMLIIYIFRGYMRTTPNIGELMFFVVLLSVSLIIAIGFGGLSGVLGARLRKLIICN